MYFAVSMQKNTRSRVTVCFLHTYFDQVSPGSFPGKIRGCTNG